MLETIDAIFGRGLVFNVSLVSLASLVFLVFISGYFSGFSLKIYFSVFYFFRSFYFFSILQNDKIRSVPALYTVVFIRKL